MMRLAPLLCSAALLLPSSALAEPCRCDPEPSVENALHGASAVFEGRVLRVRFSKENPTVGVARMQVVRAWKGVSAEELDLQTALSGQPAAATAPGCAVPLSQGQSYLVYSIARPDGQLETSACSRTRPIKDADADLAVLGMGSAPIVASSTGKHAEAASDQADSDGARHEPPARGGCASCSVLNDKGEPPSALWLSLGVLALLWRLQRRRSR